MKYCAVLAALPVFLFGCGGAPPAASPPPGGGMVVAPDAPPPPDSMALKEAAKPAEEAEKAEEASKQNSPVSPSRSAAASDKRGKADEDFSEGGLGLVGTGPGGGGTGEAVGLGATGSMGHGSASGFGQGSSGGQGAGPAPNMVAGATSVSGRLPPEVIQKIVRQSFGRLRLCYENGLRNNPALQGKVRVKFVIGKDGIVSNAVGGRSDLPDLGVVSCVVKQFSAMRFPAPEGGVVVVEYPIDLSPGDAPSAAPAPKKP